MLDASLLTVDNKLLDAEKFQSKLSLLSVGVLLFLHALGDLGR